MINNHTITHPVAARTLRALLGLRVQLAALQRAIEEEAAASALDREKQIAWKTGSYCQALQDFNDARRARGREAILGVLSSKTAPVCAKGIADELNLHAPSVRRHLRALLEAGRVTQGGSWKRPMWEIKQT